MKTLPKQLRGYVFQYNRFYSYSRYDLMWILEKAIKNQGDYTLHDKAQLKTKPACLHRNRSDATDAPVSYHSTDPTKRVVRLLDSTLEDQQDLLQQLKDWE